MLTKTLTAGVLAVSLSLTSLAPTRAAALSDEDVAVGIISLLLLGAAIHNNRDRSHAAPAPTPTPQPQANRGWRVLAAESKYEEAAGMIQNYLDSRSDLKEDQIRILHFHTGQMLAYCDQYEKAKAHFTKSLAFETHIHHTFNHLHHKGRLSRKNDSSMTNHCRIFSHFDR